jgi:hypothetical protein
MAAMVVQVHQPVLLYLQQQAPVVEAEEAIMLQDLI